MIPWKQIDTVLLDMDGTLLDKHFDDYFWEELVPEKYAEKNGLPLQEAKQRLYAAYRTQEKTLNWTDLSYWSERLELDIIALKWGICGRVQVHPGVTPFLEFVKRQRKKIVLATNADPKTVQMKMEQTPLSPFFDTILCASDLGFPKEDIGFWKGAKAAVGFDQERSLFVDDNEEVLLSAQAFGIKYLLFKTHASSRIARVDSERFPSVKDFGELIP